MINKNMEHDERFCILKRFLLFIETVHVEGLYRKLSLCRVSFHLVSDFRQCPPRHDSKKVLSDRTVGVAASSNRGLRIGKAIRV